MIEFKDCPKYKGDLNPDRDRYGAFFTCLQCGYVKDVGLAAKEGPKKRKSTKKKAA